MHNNSPKTEEQLELLLAALKSSAQQIAPAFFEIMPRGYFNSVDRQTQLSHLKALVATEISEFPQEILLKNEKRLEYTYLIKRSYPGLLSEMLERLPHGQPLNSAKIFTAKDNSLIIDIFNFGDLVKHDSRNKEESARAKELNDYCLSHDPGLEEKLLQAHIGRCSKQYLTTIKPPRYFRHFQIAEKIRGSSDTIIERDQHEEAFGITVGIGMPNRRSIFERISKYLGHIGIDIRRANLESFKESSHASVALLGFTADYPEPINEEMWSSIHNDLKRLNYLDKKVLRFAYSQPSWSLREAEVIFALANLSHQLLVKNDPYAFSRNRIEKSLLKHIELAQKVAQHFIQRFSPGESPANADELRELVETSVNYSDGKKIFLTLVDAIFATKKTNLLVPNRYALSLRIDATFLETTDREHQPFGAFYVFGRGFDGFHVRFRDVARGGIRIVKPNSTEQYAFETERLYDEAYNLAFAQQLKNKDIPEGGSKGVILVSPNSRVEFTGRAYADALLDLITPDTTTREFIVDRHNKTEILYLGPDENVSDSLISWIVDRAKMRGYPLADAFMSSKPGAGINHKRYGVTSEGVTVFLEHALLSVGINPRKQKFSVKLAGGPDGDVAGNEIKILVREFGDNAQIVAIADGSGCAEDVNGLQHAELLKLVERSAPISQYDTSLLGETGKIYIADTQEGIAARNTLHNRIYADAFIPAGGRPRTINIDNFQSYFSNDGKAASKVIVEGANLYITEEARNELADKGVVVLKDSSANKCGVICSSFEIMASMLLEEDKFIKIKDVFVCEVIEKLRELAEFEAKVLFREQRHKPNTSMPDLSTRLSNAITYSADAVFQTVNTLNPEVYKTIVRGHLPESLVAAGGEALFDKIPAEYLNNIVSTNLASRMIYREGIDFVEQMPSPAIASLAASYLEKELEVRLISEEIEDLDLPNKAKLLLILNNAGARVLLDS